MGIVGLRYLDEDNAYRRSLADGYDTALAGAPGVEHVPVAPGCVPSRHLYQVLVDDRDEVMAGLNRRRVYPGVHYQDNTSYAMYAGSRGTCPVAARAAERVVSLPLHLRLTGEDVLRVAAGLRDAIDEVEAASR
jgi:dTDP-4-amino-4,6-dideoxygalactose transaminase